MQSFAFFFVTISLCLGFSLHIHEAQPQAMLNHYLPTAPNQHHGAASLLQRWCWQHCRRLGHPYILIKGRARSEAFTGIKIGWWCFHIFFVMFIPKFGEMIPILTNIFFKGGWFNHQLVKTFQLKHRHI